MFSWWIKSIFVMFISAGESVMIRTVTSRRPVEKLHKTRRRALHNSTRRKMSLSRKRRSFPPQRVPRREKGQTPSLTKMIEFLNRLSNVPRTVNRPGLNAFSNAIP